MNETTIKVRGQTYGIGKLDALTQFHLARRIAPLLATMGISLESLKSGAQIQMDDLVMSLGPVTQVLSAMSDAELDYVLSHSLNVVTRQQDEKTWARVSTGALGARPLLMFDDIDMAAMVRLTIEVLKANLLDFFTGQNGLNE